MGSLWRQRRRHGHLASPVYRQPERCWNRQCPRLIPAWHPFADKSTTLYLPTYAFLHNYGLFVEDTYQATPNLTVTAGLRWEQPGSFSEEHNIGAVFLPECASDHRRHQFVYQSAWRDGAAEGHRRHCWIHRCILHGEKNRFIGRHSLRVWALPTASIPRASFVPGYGISFFPAVLDQDGPQLSSLTRSATNNLNTAGQPIGATVANPFPTGITPALGHSQTGIDNLLGSGVWARAGDQPLGYSQQWNLAVERTFGSSSRQVLPTPDPKERT